MNSVQKEILTLFKALKSELDANHIQYISAGGTTIGAVRHQGFIPWDDDMDIAMERQAFEVFRAVVQHNDGKIGNLEVILPETTENAFCYAKVYSSSAEDGFYDKTNGMRGLFIDIFPLDFVSSSKIHRYADFLHFKVLNKVILQRQLGSHSPFGPKWLPFMPVILWYQSFSLENLKQKRLTLMTTRKSNHAIMTNYGGPYKFDRDNYLTNEIKVSSELKFEDTTIKVPDGFDTLLTRTYGDYMALPPEKDREAGHILKTK